MNSICACTGISSCASVPPAGVRAEQEMFFIVPVGHCKPIISWHLQDTLEELSLDPPKQPCQEEQQTSQTQILDTMFCTGIAGLWEWSAIPNGLITPGHAAEIRVFLISKSNYSSELGIYRKTFAQPSSALIAQTPAFHRLGLWGRRGSRSQPQTQNSG